MTKNSQLSLDASKISLCNDAYRGIWGNKRDRITWDNCIQYSALKPGEFLQFRNGRSRRWQTDPPAPEGRPRIPNLQRLEVRLANDQNVFSPPQPWHYGHAYIDLGNSGNISLLNDTGKKNYQTSDHRLKVEPFQKPGSIKDVKLQFRGSDGVWRDEQPDPVPGHNNYIVRVVGAGDDGGYWWRPRRYGFFYFDFKSLKVELANDTGKNKTDRVTRDDRLKITGVARGAVPEFQWSDGSWRRQQPVFGFGKNTAKVRQRVLQAQDGSLSSVTTFEFTRVKKDQDLPLLNALEVKLANDTGEDTNDRVTTDDQLKIGGLVNGAVAEYQWQDGTWHKKQPVFEHGKNTVKVRQRADDGSVSPSTTFQFTRVKKDQDRPLLNALEVKLANDTGDFKYDRVTTDDQLKIGGLVTGAVAEYQWQDESWHKKPPVFELGKNKVEVRQRADDGSVSPSTSFQFLLVKKDQDRQRLNEPEVKLANDTGEDTNDRITTDDQLKIGGLVKDNVAEYQWQDGSWHKKPPVFELGKNTFKVRQRGDMWGVSPSTTFQFTLVKELNALEVKLANDTGKSNTDRRTHDPELKIGGLVNGANVEYQWGKDEWRDKPPVFKDGSNLVTVRQSDSYGYKSKPSTFEFTFLRKKELQPLVISLKNDTGWHESNPEWGSDRITTDPVLQISGRAKDAEIEYKFDQYKGYGEPNNGLWWKWKSEWGDNYKWKSYHWQYPVDFGGDINTFSSSVENTIHFRQVDPDGNMSKETSFTFNFYPDLDRGYGFPSPSLSVKNDMSYVSPNRQSWWGGRSRDHQLVTNPKPQEGEFYEWKGPRATTWSATYPPLDDFSVGGKNTVWVRRRDSVGNISRPTYLTFELEAAPKHATTPSLSLKNDTGIDDDHVTTEMGLVVSGYFGESQLSFRHSYRESEFSRPTSDDQWDDIASLSKPSHVQNYIDSKIRKLTKPGYYTFEVKKKYNDYVSFKETKNFTSPISTLNVQLLKGSPANASPTNDVPSYTPNKNPETLPFNSGGGGKGHKEDTGLGGFFSMARDSGESQFDKRTDYTVTDMFELHLKKPAIDGSGYQYQINGSPWRLMRAPNPLSDLRTWVLPWPEKPFNNPGENTILIRYFHEDSDYYSEPYKYKFFLGDDSVRPTYTPNKNPETLPVSHGHSEDTGLGADFVMLDDSGPSQIDKRTNPRIQYTGLFKLYQKDALPDASSYQYQMNGSSWRTMKRQSGDDVNKAIWTFPYDSPYWAGENTISIRYFDSASDNASQPYEYRWYLGDDAPEPVKPASPPSVEYDLDEDIEDELGNDLAENDEDDIEAEDNVEADEVEDNSDSWKDTGYGFKVKLEDDLDESTTDEDISSEQSDDDLADQVESYVTSTFNIDQLTANSLASAFSNALPESSIERFASFSRFSLSKRSAFRDKFADSITSFNPSAGDQLLMDRDWLNTKSRKNLLAVVYGRRAEREASKSKASLVYNQKSGNLFLNGNADLSGWGRPKTGGLLVELDAGLLLGEANIFLV